MVRSRMPAGSARTVAVRTGWSAMSSVVAVRYVVPQRIGATAVIATADVVLLST